MKDLEDFMGCTNLINAIREGDFDFVHKSWDWEHKNGSFQEPFWVKSAKYNNRNAHSFAANAISNRSKILLSLPSKYKFEDCFNQRDTKNRTPMSYAASYGDHEAIKVLKDFGGNSVDVIDADGRNLLHLLALPGDWLPRTDTVLDQTRKLLANNSIKYLKANQEDMERAADTIIFYMGLLNITEDCVVAKDKFGMTPIDYAAAFFDFLNKKFKKYVRDISLIDPAPLPAAVTIFGRDALQRYIVDPQASKNYKEDLPQLLQKYDVFSRNSENGGIDAIKLAYLYNKPADFIAILEAAALGKDPKKILQSDNFGALTLHYAAHSNKFNSLDCLARHLKRLKDHGLLEQAINHQDAEGRTALHVLVMTHTTDDDLKKQVSAYVLLLENGALPFVHDKNDNTPYDLAILYGNQKLANEIAKIASPKLLDPPKENLRDYKGKSCGLFSGCLQFSGGLKKLVGSFTVNSTTTNHKSTHRPEDSNRAPLLGTAKKHYMT